MAGQQTRERKKKQPKKRMLVEGRRPVGELIDKHIPLKTAYVANIANKRDASFERIVSQLHECACPIEYVDNSVLDKLSCHGAHQGIIVEIAPYEYADIEDIINKTKDKQDCLIVLLDHLTDEGNFGAIVRSAEVVGASGVVIPNVRSAKVGIGACTTSVGAVFQVPIAQVSNLASAIDKLKEAGFWVFGSTEHATQDVWSSGMKGKVVLVMGNEGSGISKLILDRCDMLVKLPQKGRIESLNVAQAATVMCYEWLRQCSESR